MAAKQAARRTGQGVILETSADLRASTTPREGAPEPSVTTASGRGTTSKGGGLAPHVSSPFPLHKAARAVLRIRRGWSVQDALVASGIPRQTWYSWLSANDTAWSDGSQRSPEAVAFAARLSHAIARAQALCAGRATETVLQASRSSVGTLDWRAAHEHLKHADATRARWHEHRELKIEHGGRVDHAHRLVREMDDTQLLEGLDAEWTLLLPAPAED